MTPRSHKISTGLDLRSFSEEGFTMIEVVIVLFIITSIAVLVLANFRGFGEGVAVQRSVQALAVNLRQAQNMSLAVRQIDTASGPLTPPAVGVYFDISKPRSYFIFADLDNNKKFNDDKDVKIGEDVLLERGVTISSMVDQNSVSKDIVNVVFAAPEASVTIYDSNNSLGEQVLMELVSVSGSAKKKIRVRTSGQISIE